MFDLLPVRPLDLQPGAGPPEGQQPAGPPNAPGFVPAIPAVQPGRHLDPPRQAAPQAKGIALYQQSGGADAGQRQQGALSKKAAIHIHPSLPQGMRLAAFLFIFTLLSLSLQRPLDPLGGVFQQDAPGFQLIADPVRRGKILVFPRLLALLDHLLDLCIQAGGRLRRRRLFRPGCGLQ